MTYKQILQIENYITEIESLRNLQIEGEELFNSAQTLDNRIASSVKDYSPKGINWDDAKILLIDSCYYDSKLIKNYLSIMSAGLQGILNGLSNYDELCYVREDISYGSRIGDRYRLNFVIEKVGRYANKIKFSNEIISFVNDLKEKAIVDETLLNIIYSSVMSSLEKYLQDLLLDKPQVVQQKSSSPMVNVYQNNTQSVNLNLDISIENCLKELDDCESLTQLEIDDIKKQLDEIQTLLKDKKGKKKSIREKIASMLKWVADKGTDVMIALLPTLVTILTNLQVG